MSHSSGKRALSTPFRTAIITFPAIAPDIRRLLSTDSISVSVSPDNRGGLPTSN